MNDKKARGNSYEDPPKREWVVHKLPIKGGGVIRAAMQVELFERSVPWSTIEGTVNT